MQKYLLLLLPLFLACQGDLSQQKFFVEGNCQECKSLIENGVLGLDGVKEADWDPERSFLSVKFAPGDISLEEIQEAVAGLGFNTQFFDGDPAQRSLLPTCCTEPIQQKIQPNGMHSHP
jgi:mercuric ion binding protein